MHDNHGDYKHDFFPVCINDLEEYLSKAVHIFIPILCINITISLCFQISDAHKFQKYENLILFHHFNTL